MSTSLSERIPRWTVGDRMRKARMQTGLNVREFAARVGVSANTVSAAETDKHAPRRLLLNAWAMATGVPVEWLETGQDPTQPSGPGGVNVQYLRVA